MLQDGSGRAAHTCLVLGEVKDVVGAVEVRIFQQGGNLFFELKISKQESGNTAGQTIQNKHYRLQSNSWRDNVEGAQRQHGRRKLGA